MIGEVFGRWTVEAKAARGSYWCCVCECGARREVFSTSLKSGRSRSCGCLNRDVASARRTHGATNTPEYTSWLKMRERCWNPRHLHFANYGGRGIKICDEWSASFEAFLRDMGPRPSVVHTLERLDGDGNYEPGNCCWATRKEQNRNTRKCRPVIRSDGALFPSIGAAAEAVGGSWHLTKRACRTGAAYKGFTWRLAA